MVQLGLPEVAISIVLGNRLDYCLFLLDSRHQKCWKSGIFYRAISICYIDGVVGKFFIFFFIHALGKAEKKITWQRILEFYSIFLSTDVLYNVKCCKIAHEECNSTLT